MTAMTYVRSNNEMPSIAPLAKIRISLNSRINALAIYNEGSLW